MHALSRRQFLCAANLAPFARGLDSRAFAQEKQPAALAPPNRFSRAIHEEYVEQLRAAEKIGIGARAKLKTKADAEARVKDVRARRSRRASASCQGLARMEDGYVVLAADLIGISGDGNDDVILEHLNRARRDVAV